LIPVGAALIARERLAMGVGDAISTYSSSTKIEAQLRRFERRGGSARKRLEREVRKTRTRLERGVRQRRRELERRRTRVSKDVSSQLGQAQEQLEKTQTWLGDTLRARIDDGTDLAGRVQERVLS
jgi:DNA anti-recombination protein RmuC